MNTKTKSDEAAKRRVREVRLLQAGHKPAEVAAMIGAPRQTVYRWKDVLETQGIDALRDMSKGGRPTLLGAEELVGLQVALMEGPTAHGFGTPLWTIKRVRVFIEREFGVRYSDVHVWRLLGQMGFSSQKPERRALDRDEVAIEDWKKRIWPALKKNPRREGRLILFIDESGLSQRPTRARTWALKGHSPVVQFCFNWDWKP